jgi:hypothetical protein
MREWLSSLTIDRVPEIALGLALGYALVKLAETLVAVPVSVLAQHAGRHPSGDDVFGLLDLYSAPYYLYVDVGGTLIAYGQVLLTALVLGVVALVAIAIVRRRDAELGACPFCASRIPHESTHCAYCGSGVAPGGPRHESV